MPDLSIDLENSYLLRLMGRLAAGMAALDPAAKARHRDLLWLFQKSDGGFSGRDGGSDIYYTSFAVRTLALLDGLDEERCAPIAAYLRTVMNRPVSLVDLVSLFYSALHLRFAGGPNVFDDWHEGWDEKLVTMIESFRVADGGYAKTHEGASGSTYNTFMVILCYEVLGRRPPEPEKIIAFVRGRQRDDGGFVEIKPMRRGGTNPTAAAVALLRILGGIDDDVIDGVRDFLKEVRGEEGGFRANTQIPICDLLSTFTGMVTARDLGLDGIYKPAAVESMARSLELPTGGFLAGVWDREADPEYTFYGLGTLALLKE